MPAPGSRSSEGIMRVMGARHKEKRLFGGLGAGEEVPGKAAIYLRVPAPEVLVTLALPGVGR